VGFGCGTAWQLASVMLGILGSLHDVLIQYLTCGCSSVAA
jgi:hypothetical protein